MGAAIARSCRDDERCRGSLRQRQQQFATSQYEADARLNDDVRQIVAEFACDSVLLALRLQSTRWYATVAAAITEVGAVSATRAMLCPQIVVDAPQDARTCDALVRASMALMHNREAVDFTVFPNLCAVDMTQLFQSIRRIVEDDKHRARIVVDLSTVSERTALPVIIGVSTSAVGTLILPPNMEMPLRNVNRCVLHRLDLSHMPLEVLPRNFVNSAKLQELVLPSSISTLENYSFSGLTIPRLDLSHLTEVTYLPRNFVNGAKVQELVLPPTVHTLDQFCFSGMTLPRLDLSRLDGLTVLSRNFLHTAHLQELLLPQSITAVEQFCFSGLAIPVLDMSHMTKLVVLPSNWVNGAQLEKLILPSSATSLQHNCFNGLVLPQLDLSHLSGVTALPLNCLNGAALQQLVIPPSLQTHVGVLSCQVITTDNHRACADAQRF